MSISNQIAAVLLCGAGTAFAVNMVFGGEADRGEAQALYAGDYAASVSPSSYDQFAHGQVRIDKGRNGHFETEIRLNGTPTEVLIDTGASLLALRESDARRAGILAQRTAYHHRLETANGYVDAAKVSIRQIEIGTVRLRNVDAFLLPDNALKTNLLGMNVLSEFGEVKISGDRLVLDTRAR